MSYAICKGCNNTFKAGTGLSNHQRGCGMLIAKMTAAAAASSSTNARLEEQRRTIEAQAALIAQQQHQIAKLANKPTTTIVNNNTMNINIVATEKVANAISARFEQFNLALAQWMQNQKQENGQDAPLRIETLIRDLQDAPDKSFLQTYNHIVGNIQEGDELEIEADAEEIDAADEAAIEKHQKACEKGSRTMLRLLTNG